MRELQKALDEVLAELPYKMLASLVRRRLAAQGVRLSARETRKLEQGIKSATSGEFQYHSGRWWDRRHATVELSEADVKELEGRALDFIDRRLPELIESEIYEISRATRDRLDRAWRGEARRQRRLGAGFRSRLERRWREPLDLLRMLLTVAREFGDEVNRETRNVVKRTVPPKVEVLTRCHARACQVTEEVVCLLAGGFADGAVARWRTLHEIAVVAAFIGEGGDTLAERYLAHRAVQSFSAARVYERCQGALGYEPITASEMAAVQRAHDAAVERFGSPFHTQYGWAAEALGKKRPTFEDIERAAGIQRLRAHYRYASHNVHANATGAFLRLGLLPEHQVLLAGPSNFGLADAGHATAISLLQVSACLVVLAPVLDNIIALRIMEQLEQDIGQAFLAVQTVLSRVAARH